MTAWAQRSAAYKARKYDRRRANGIDIGRARSGKRKPRPVTFVAVDGEGLTRDDGQHDYVTLQASDNTMVERWERNGLSTRQCFDYLLELHARNPHATLVAFAFGYDTNMMLRDVNRAELERVNSGEYTVVGDEYLVKFIAGKSLYVGRGHYDDNNEWITDVGVTVWDTWGFFQSSFVAALSEWEVCSPDTIEIIARMKDKRGEFDDEIRALIVSYCFRECALLVTLMEAFKAVADTAGIKLTRWDGAGACASALLRAYSMKPYIRPERQTPDEVERAALYAYFGGRIEIFGSGVVDGTAYEYDINSAYPSEIAALPSMRDGRWQHWYALGHAHGRCIDDALYRVRWDVGNALVSPFPWRDDTGNVLYRTRGEGWYHGVEVQAARDVYGAGIEILEGWEWHPTTDERPWEWVRALYLQRRAYKEAGDARHIVLKLALNAMYGKLAQSVGFKRNEPPAYQSYYLAGRVTAGTRAHILRVSAMAETAIISTMTDALFTREPIAGLPLSKELGEWDAKVLEPGLLVVQPGVVLSPQSPCESCAGNGCYRCAAGRRMSFGRSRGFQRVSLDYTTARSAWETLRMLATFTVTENRFIGMGRALASKALAEWDLEREPERDILGTLISEQWRRWVTIQKRVSFRANIERKGTGRDLYDNWVTWWPERGEQVIGTMYKPKTVYRTLNAIEDKDTADNHGEVGVNVGV
ncbi:MAG: DNA polymerase [Candidatus Acidiferrales bacterium]